MNAAVHDSLRRQARVLLLLQAADKAGLCPLDIRTLHGFAYLANVLAPVWDMPALDGKVLKRRGGVFYPDLQHDVDLMVGHGVLLISDVAHALDADGRWRLEGRYRLHREFATPPLEFLSRFQDQQRVDTFVTELAYALSALGELEFESAFAEDATYGDPTVSDDNVLDFSEWALRNPTARAVAYFDRFMPAKAPATKGEKLHLYVRHLRKRLHERE